MNQFVDETGMDFRNYYIFDIETQAVYWINEKLAVSHVIVKDNDQIKRELIKGNVLNQYYMTDENTPIDLHLYLDSPCDAVQYTPVVSLPFWIYPRDAPKKITAMTQASIRPTEQVTIDSKKTDQKVSSKKVSSKEVQKKSETESNEESDSSSGSRRHRRRRQRIKIVIVQQKTKWSDDESGDNDDGDKTSSEQGSNGRGRNVKGRKKEIGEEESEDEAENTRAPPAAPENNRNRQERNQRNQARPRRPRRPPPSPKKKGDKKSTCVLL